MCTMGALFHRHHAYLLKTLDFGVSGVYAGRFRHSEGCHDVVGIGMLAQAGLNAGINDAGVGLMMSYFGTSKDEEYAMTGHGQWNDVRGILNAKVLFNVQSAKEGMEMLAEMLCQQDIPVGGSHIIMDQQGCVGIVEHLNGQVHTAFYTTEKSTVFAFGNTASLGFLEAQQALPVTIQEDRLKRKETMRQQLEQLTHNSLSEDLTQASLRQVLALHGDSPEEIGSICIHHFTLPGARANLQGEMSTIAGIIIDVNHLSIDYSVGNPCQNQWRSIADLRI